MVLKYLRSFLLLLVVSSSIVSGRPFFLDSESGARSLLQSASATSIAQLLIQGNAQAAAEAISEAISGGNESAVAQAAAIALAAGQSDVLAQASSLAASEGTSSSALASALSNASGTTIQPQTLQQGNTGQAQQQLQQGSQSSASAVSNASSETLNDASESTSTAVAEALSQVCGGSGNIEALAEATATAVGSFLNLTLFRSLSPKDCS